MLRLFAVLLCLTLAAPALAQSSKEPADAVATLAEEKARADKAEMELAIQQAAERLEDAQTAQAYNRFEIWTGALIGGFSLLITVLILWFATRTEKAAAAAAAESAASEAQSQLASVNQEIETLRSNAALASDTAKLAADKAQGLLEEIVRNAELAAKNAAQTVIDQGRTADAASLIERRMAGLSESTRESAKLTPSEESIVNKAALGTEDKAESEWSVDEFKTRIGKARFIEEDWLETIRLAILMAEKFATDDEAFAFAGNAQGDALRELARHEEAVSVYGKVIERLGKEPSDTHAQAMMWASHHTGFCLTAFGRFKDAETELRALLPIRERVDGPEHVNTLTTRHELARAILNQGRAADAEAEFLKFLPVRERVEGAESAGTLTTRHELARAILMQGRAAEAEEEFRAFLPI
jgi:tetratricopeptide (TPR) repeat protein